MPLVTVVVQTGPPTLVSTVDIGFRGAISDDPAAAQQRAGIQAGWKLPAGERFTQEGWDDAKTQALRQLSAQRYPVGKVAASRAEIDPDNLSARLSVELDSGPAYRLGAMQVKGLDRYEPALVERIARLKPGARIRPGQPARGAAAPAGQRPLQFGRAGDSTQPATRRRHRSS